MMSNKLARIFLCKASRVFVSGLVSVSTPIYLATLGYSPFAVGLSVLVMVAGNVFSNVILARCERRFGRKTFLLLFSALMIVAGLLLYLTTDLPLILLAFFIGNVSTTGTEAGPFQSVEAGVLPRLVSPSSLNRTFGAYNVLGYGAASLGALASGIPGYFQSSAPVFRLLYLLYGLVGLILLILYAGLGSVETPHDVETRIPVISDRARRDIVRLSVLNSVDAFGGGFVTQSLLSYWFFLTYQVSIAGLGVIFFLVNIVTAVSIFGASLIAERLGNLRTMVSTHLLSNAFLTVIPFAGSLTLSLAFLFLRQSLSQMDVPTRQAFMAGLFEDRTLVTANATTNTFRGVGSLFGAPITGALFAVDQLALPIVAGGVSKIVYDIAIYLSYRHRK